ncbi:MAG TPA: hypothetical protein VL970_07320, partial [Candidatus Acidoferrales bacterium]|nr:hypothetical protein [Candidatus Acidoferrales bacterium]
MDQTGVKKDPFRGGGLAGVNVCGNPDVAGAFEGVFAVGRMTGFGFSAHRFKIAISSLPGIKNAPAISVGAHLKKALPTEMGEGLVCLRHLVNFVPL